jgi:hypothetical protein
MNGHEFMKLSDYLKQLENLERAEHNAVDARKDWSKERKAAEHDRLNQWYRRARMQARDKKEDYE